MITVSGTKFLKNGKPWTPIGLCSTKTGINNRGGLDEYMKTFASYGVDLIRIHIPGTVDRVCDPLTQQLTGECIEWIIKIGEATMKNNIYMVVMPFPNSGSWQYNPLKDNYGTIWNWWQDGLDSSKRLLDNIQLEIDQYWNVAFWEVINEVHLKTKIETDLACGVLDHLRNIQGAPVCVSLDKQETAGTEFGQQVIASSDIVNAHTYVGNPNLNWVPNDIKDEWRRLERMPIRAALIGQYLSSVSNGKPYLSSEDPLYLTWGPITNWFRGIIGRPQNEDIAANFIERSQAWITSGGAAMPGIMWGMCYGDYPQHILEATKDLSEEIKIWAKVSY